MKDLHSNKRKLIVSSDDESRLIDKNTQAERKKLKKTDSLIETTCINSLNDDISNKKDDFFKIPIPRKNSSLTIGKAEINKLNPVENKLISNKAADVPPLKKKAIVESSNNHDDKKAISMKFADDSKIIEKVSSSNSSIKPIDIKNNSGNTLFNLGEKKNIADATKISAKGNANSSLNLTSSNLNSSNKIDHSIKI